MLFQLLNQRIEIDGLSELLQAKLLQAGVETVNGCDFHIRGSSVDWHFNPEIIQASISDQYYRVQIS